MTITSTRTLTHTLRTTTPQPKSFVIQRTNLASAVTPKATWFLCILVHSRETSISERRSCFYHILPELLGVLLYHWWVPTLHAAERTDFVPLLDRCIPPPPFVRLARYLFVGVCYGVVEMGGRCIRAEFYVLCLFRVVDRRWRDGSGRR